MTILRGIPGSGKSTYRKAMQQKYVNLDELRDSFPTREEKYRRALQDDLICSFMNDNVDFIIDNTHIHEYSYQKYVKWAENAGYNIDVVNFHTNLRECLNRNEAREKKIPKSVIFRMAHDFGYHLRAEYFDIYNISQRATIIDLDGTLCNIDHRLHYVQQEKKDWNGFFSRLSDDVPYMAVYDMLVALKSTNYAILLVSGREEKWRKETEAWLNKFDIPCDWLLMRPFNDRRDDTEVKEEIYKRYISPYFHVQMCIDDRPSVCRKWRELGLTCFQIQDKEF